MSHQRPEAQRNLFCSGFLALTLLCTPSCLAPQPGPAPFHEPLPPFVPFPGPSPYHMHPPEKLGPAQGCVGSSPPPFWCFTSREFLWKQSLESLPSLESPGPYPGGPAAKPRPAAGVCVGVWPWRFIICGRREALPLEAFLLSSHKGLWPRPPGQQTSAEGATGPTLTSLPGCQPPHFSLPHPWWALASLWLAPLSCLLLLHVADMSLTLFTFLPLSRSHPVYR